MEDVLGFIDVVSEFCGIILHWFEALNNIPYRACSKWPRFPSIKALNFTPLFRDQILHLFLLQNKLNQKFNGAVYLELHLEIVTNYPEDFSVIYFRKLFSIYTKVFQTDKVNSKRSTDIVMEVKLRSLKCQLQTRHQIDSIGHEGCSSVHVATKPPETFRTSPLPSGLHYFLNHLAMLWKTKCDAGQVKILQSRLCTVGNCKWWRWTERLGIWIELHVTF